MNPVLLIIASLVGTPEPPKFIDRGEILADALRFCACRGIVKSNLKTIELHDEMIRAYPQECWAAWSSRQDEVRRAWRYLDKALDSSWPMCDRVDAMEYLRTTIGDAAFHGGSMPPPIPNYGNWCPALAK